MTERNAESYKDDKIEFRPDGQPELSDSLDEVIAFDIRAVHLERMDKNAYWLGVDLRDGRHIGVNFWTGKRATIKVNAEIEPAEVAGESGPAEPRLDTREKFRAQAHELNLILDKLRPGTGPGVETLVMMAWDEAWQSATVALRSEVTHLRASWDAALKSEHEALHKYRTLEAERDQLKEWNEHMTNAFLRDESIQPDGSLRATLKDVILRAETAEVQVKQMAEALRQHVKKGHNDTCSKMVAGKEYECDCGYELADRALAGVSQPK